MFLIIKKKIENWKNKMSNQSLNNNLQFLVQKNYFKAGISENKVYINYDRLFEKLNILF